MSCAACKHIPTLTRSPCAYCGRLNVESELAREQLRGVATAEQFRAHGDARRGEGFRSGLRRAQELAKEYGGYDFDINGFDRAIDAAENEGG